MKGSIVAPNELGDNKFIRATLAMMIFLFVIYEGCCFKELHFENGFLRAIFIHIWSLDSLVDIILTRSCLFYLVIYYYNYFFLVFFDYISYDSAEMKELLSLDDSVEIERIIKIACGLMIFSSFSKALNLLKLNPKTYLITASLNSGYVELSIMISFLLLNYILLGLFGHVIFQQDYQFSNIKHAVYSSIISIASPIEFSQLIESNFSWLFTWQMFLFLYMEQILLNFVVSIIIAYFDKVVSSHKKSKTEKTFNRVLKNSFEYFNVFSKQTSAQFK